MVLEIRDFGSYAAGEGQQAVMAYLNPLFDLISTSSTSTRGS
jgi:hypothetical protein